MISEHDVIIKPLSVQPFTWDSTCPACGVDSKGWWLAFRRLMYGRCHTAVNVAFCPGGRPPVEEREDHNPMSLVIGPDGPVFGGTKEVRHACYGVDTPHLHVKCRQCDCAWLMATMQ